MAEANEETLPARRQVTLAEALTLLPGPQGKNFAPVLRHGTLLVEIVVFHGTDAQQPHTQDELYVVLQGSGEFVNGDTRRPFGPHDVLFVPAGVVHRFVNFTDDVIVWAIFYGPEGGEAEG